MFGVFVGYGVFLVSGYGVFLVLGGYGGYL